jgi:hypothetical protein
VRKKYNLINLLNCIGFFFQWKCNLTLLLLRLLLQLLWTRYTTGHGKVANRLEHLLGGHQRLHCHTNRWTWVKRPGISAVAWSFPAIRHSWSVRSAWGDRIFARSSAFCRQATGGHMGLELWRVCIGHVIGQSTNIVSMWHQCITGYQLEIVW